MRNWQRKSRVLELAISNTGPLIAFAKVQRLDLLTSLFSEILIPRAVADELTACEAALPGAEILSMKGFRVVELPGGSDALLEAELDSGEAAVVQLALKMGGTEVLLDERKARRLAESVYNLKVLGTGGLLLRAKKKGLIKEVKSTLHQIRANGYYLSERLVLGIERAAGEAE
jgi:predicted nucleic acid-binding protein